jgi:hypothetical protein
MCLRFEFASINTLLKLMHSKVQAQLLVYLKSAVVEKEQSDQLGRFN